MKKKDPRAVRRGRQGGLQRGKNLSPAERTSSARFAASKRWSRHHLAQVAGQLVTPGEGHLNEYVTAHQLVERRP